MEKIFSNQILEILSNDFYVYREVCGKHFSGAKLRIDAVVKPKDCNLWKDSNVSLGIEFKSVEKLKDTKDKRWSGFW